MKTPNLKKNIWRLNILLSLGAYTAVNAWERKIIFWLRGRNKFFASLKRLIQNFKE